MGVVFKSYRNEVMNAIEQAKSRALETVGGMAESDVKRKLTQNKSVQSGILRNSITHQRVDENTEAIGTDIEYAPYVEFGHHQQPGRYVPALKKRLKLSWVPPKPFMRPAVEGNMKKYRAVIENEMPK